MLPIFGVPKNNNMKNAIDVKANLKPEQVKEMVKLLYEHLTLSEKFNWMTKYEKDHSLSFKEIKGLAAEYQQEMETSLSQVNSSADKLKINFEISINY